MSSTSAQPQATRSVNAPPARAGRDIAAWLWLALLAVYLLNYSGHITAADETSMLVVARNLVERHSFDATTQIWEYQAGITPPQDTFGANGELYSKKGPGQPLLLAGLEALANFINSPSPVQIALWSNVIVTACAGVAVFVLLRALTARMGVALLGALIFALATPALPYAKTLFNEPLTGLCLVLGVCGLVWWEASHKARALFVSGVALAFAVAVRQEAVLFAALCGLYLLWLWWHQPQRCFIDLLVFGAPLLVSALALMAYNLGTSGSVLATPYQLNSEAESFSTPIWDGLFGLFLSPGKGLFVYAPVLLLALPGFVYLWARRCALALLLAALILSYAGLHAAFHDWWGGTAWGPRPLIPLLPVFALLAGCGIAAVWPRRAGRWAVALLAVVSVAIELLGTSVNYTAYAAQLSQIRPDAEWTIGVYDPAYSPIVGHARLLGQVTPDFVWANGGADALVEDAAVWRSVASLLASNVRPSDLLLNSAPAGRAGLLYFDRSPARWLNFVEEPMPLAAQTRAYLDRYAQSNERIWLTTWKTRETNPNLGIEAWLAARAYNVAHWEFDKPARVLLYERPRVSSAFGHAIPFGGVVALVATQLESPTATAGSTLCVHNTWHVDQKPNGLLVAFTHVIDAGGTVRAQIDSAPQEGFRPSDGWAVGDTIEDFAAVSLPASLEAGDYRVVTGIYQWPSLERLKVSGSADNVVNVGTVHVTSQSQTVTPSCYGG